MQLLYNRSVANFELVLEDTRLYLSADDVNVAVVSSPSSYKVMCFSELRPVSVSQSPSAAVLMVDFSHRAKLVRNGV
ncbi:hypothetical protein QQ045_028960 [Rhodiola kirilowii]